VEIQTAIHQLHPRSEFRIARKRREPYRNVLLRVERDGIAGWGEASPTPFYGERAEDVVESLQSVAAWLKRLPILSVADIEDAWKVVRETYGLTRAAQCAVDLALWDWLAQKEGTTVTELALGRAPRPVVSFATIGLSTPEELPGKIEELRGFPRVKIKSDANADLEPVRRAREELGAEVAVDANCGWEKSQIAPLSVALSALGVSFIEQPLAPGSDSDLVRASYALPIVADESCVTEDDFLRVAMHFDGINVKLVKCGGLTPALRMLRRARKHGLRTMVGCMLETSVLIAAGCVAAQIAEYADLDGAWLIADDPCEGWQFERGVLTPPSRLGLGAKPRE
jgi:L-alanine-DL-glutamate epimerase-like enolase superfamily enzyme